MIKYSDVPIKYSILLAGQPLDFDFIRKCLKDGIKVIWFGESSDNKMLHAEFAGFIEGNFLCVYKNSKKTVLTLIDGKGAEKVSTALETLEKGDSAFNLKQYEIEHDDTNDLIIVQAGAGSGKTFVMINRLLYLMHMNDDLSMSEIVMITFTNDATDSMRKKLIETIDKKFKLTGNAKYLEWIESIPQITISTIHSFFKKMMVEIGPLFGYGTSLGLTSMTMQKRALLYDILNEKYDKSPARVESMLGLKVYEIVGLAEMFWKQIENKGLSEAEIAEMDWGSTTESAARKIQESLKGIFQEVEERYATIKFEENKIEMSDIVHEFKNILRDDRVKEYVTSKYKYMFCDEFQDSDNIQIHTLAFLNEVFDGKLFVVGDIKQSIYRFRGATDSAFERLVEYTQEELWQDVKNKEYPLSKNYRTAENILTEADQIFRKWSDKGYLKYRYSGKDTDVLVAQKHIGGVYKQIPIAKNDTEGRKKKLIAVIDKIREQDKDPGKKIMLLTRTNKQLSELKGWLEAEGKACLIKEKGTFFQSKAVVEFCYLVEALQYHTDPKYLFNLLQTSYCYSDVDLAELATYEGNRFYLLRYFKGILNEKFEWDERLETFKWKPIMANIYEIIEKSAPATKYGALQKQRYLQRGYEPEEALQQALIDAAQYDADLQKLLLLLNDMFSSDFSTLSDICKYIRLMMSTDRNENSEDISVDNDKDLIIGATVHSVKGLEYDYVLIPLMNYPFEQKYRSDILINEKQRKIGWKYKKNSTEYNNDLYAGLSPDESKEVICDETRLLYVAMTRAIKGLFCFTDEKRNWTPYKWSDLLPEAKDDANYI